MRDDRAPGAVGLAGAALGVLLLVGTTGFVAADGGLDARAGLALAAALALLAVPVVLAPGAVGSLLRDRRARIGPKRVLLGAAVTGALFAANVIASQSTRAVDLTGLYALSPRSEKAVGALDADLVVTALIGPGDQAARRGAEALLDPYRQLSRHVKLNFADPSRAPAQPPGSILLQYRDRPPIALDPTEQTQAGVTAAILRLESSRSPVVCWAGGDGERDLADPNEVTGYSGVAGLLKADRYQVRSVVLAQQGVPAGCDVLVVLQLATPLEDAAVRAIQAYLAGGGRLLMGLDPWPDRRVLAGANAVLRPYGAAFAGGLVVEQDPALAAAGDDTIPVVSVLGQPAITANLAGGYVFFPQTTFITGAGVSGVSSVDVASSSSRSYEIPEQRTDLGRRPGDGVGSFVLMRSLEQRHASGRTTRVVLAGTSALAENRTLPQNASGSNADLMTAALDWLSQQDSLTAGPRLTASQPLTLTSTGLRVNQVLTVAVMPLLVLAIGLPAYLRRGLTRRSGRWWRRLLEG